MKKLLLLVFVSAVFNATAGDYNFCVKYGFGDCTAGNTACCASLYN